MAKLTVRDLDVRGKRVFLRVDYNVPLEEKNGQMVITDATRIVETLPTLKLLIEKGGKLILTAHLGRPKGKREPTMSLQPVAVKLSELLGKPVAFVDDCIGEKVEKAVAAMKNGDVLLLENVRYYNEEEKPTTRHLPKNSPRLPMFMSMTPSARRIARMPQRKASPAWWPNAVASAPRVC